ncbi:phosphodiester glycosidase family protein [Flavisolibacter sp. BT320]|nr:phosphodiester glycosidase family protein [Flavisolibacter longurius]
MYTEDNSPVGLYIENGRKLSSMKICNSRKANFCLQPQGVFYLTKDRRAGISTVSAFSSQNVVYAIEAAPMIVIEGKENPSLPKQSTFIGNGAGIRRDGKVVLAILNRPVTFPQLAQYFIAKGCTTAVYFDGGVSMSLLSDNLIVPKRRGTRGGFGAMIAVFD